MLVLRDDQLAMQQALSGWDLKAAEPPGSLRSWRAGEVLPAEVYDAKTFNGDPRVLAPEVQLLQKSKSMREKDEADFLAVHDQLDKEQRDWLARSLAVVSPAHPWLTRL